MAYLTTAEAAKLLKVKEATLVDWRVKGEGPAYAKIGRLVRYPDYEVERYGRERLQTPIPKRSEDQDREARIPLQTERAMPSGHRFKGRTRR
jgi:excisionase family DNA binding protein